MAEEGQEPGGSVGFKSTWWRKGGAAAAAAPLGRESSALEGVRGCHPPRLLRPGPGDQPHRTCLYQQVPYRVL